MSPNRELRVFANARATATSTDFTLPAGKRQRVSDFGIYGYAMASSVPLGDALKLGFRHLPLDGPVLEISILERPLPNTLMLLPYAPPKHWREYECLFRCHVLFGQDAMEWHFDIAVMDQPCPSANSTAAQTCRSLCERILQLRVGETSLAGNIRSRCLATPPPFPTAARMARDLEVSLRDLHRRLAAEETSYKAVVDSVRESLAKEYLANTTVTVEKVAERLGYYDAANFRKVFKRWTGQTPAQYRQTRTPSPR